MVSLEHQDLWLVLLSSHQAHLPEPPCFRAYQDLKDQEEYLDLLEIL